MLPFALPQDRVYEVSIPLLFAPLCQRVTPSILGSKLQAGIWWNSLIQGLAKCSVELKTPNKCFRLLSDAVIILMEAGVVCV